MWLDFGFMDQLEIVSRLCGFIAASTGAGGGSDQIQFPLFGAGFVFNVRFDDVQNGGLNLFMGGGGGGFHKTRLVGVGAFFQGCRIPFVQGIIVS